MIKRKKYTDNLLILNVYSECNIKVTHRDDIWYDFLKEKIIILPENLTRIYSPFFGTLILSVGVNEIYEASVHSIKSNILRKNFTLTVFYYRINT